MSPQHQVTYEDAVREGRMEIIDDRQGGRLEEWIPNILMKDRICVPLRMHGSQRQDQLEIQVQDEFMCGCSMGKIALLCFIRFVSSR